MKIFPTLLLSFWTAVFLLGSAAEMNAAENFLKDGSLETLGQAGSPWKILNPSVSVPQTDEQGNRFLRVTSDEKGGTAGMRQIIHFDPPYYGPLKVGGRAKVNTFAKHLPGRPDFNVYVDAFYEDDSPLWGERAFFDQENKSWHEKETVIWPSKPLKRMEVFVLFRDFAGSVDFDDIFVEKHTLKLDSLKAFGGLTGDGSVALFGTFSWRKEWMDAEYKISLEQLSDEPGKPAVEVPLSIMPSGLTFFASARPGTEPGVKNFRFTVKKNEELFIEKTFSCDVTQKHLDHFSLWVESSMRRVYLHSLPENAVEMAETSDSTPSGASVSPALEQKAKLDAARGEAESFQIAVHSAKEMSSVDLKFSDLVSAENPQCKIPASACEWHQVGYVKSDKISMHPAEKNGLPIWFPDPLLPRKKGFVPANQTVSFWVTVSVSQEIQPGTYSGTVFWMDEGSARTIEIPLEVKVWPVTIAKENHLGSAFALMDGFLERVYGKEADLLKLRKTYGDFMIRHRLAPEGDISRTEMPSLELLKEWKDKGLGEFNILNMVHERGSRAWVCNSPVNFYSPENREKIRQKLIPYVEELRKAGLTDKAYIYTFDERREEYHSAMTDFFGMVKENFPEIKTFTTSYIGSDLELLRKLNVDWTCPLTSVYDLESAEECRRDGRQVWSYICCGPDAPYANIMFRFPLIEGRVLGWQSFEQKYDGLLYWGVNIWSVDPNVPIHPDESLFWDWATEWKLGERWIYGDGRLLYPNADGTPIGCMRLVNLRDAYEDYELLWQLNEVNPERALEICRKVSASPREFTREPKVLLQYRRELLKALSEK